MIMQVIILKASPICLAAGFASNRRVVVDGTFIGLSKILMFCLQGGVCWELEMRSLPEMGS